MIQKFTLFLLVAAIFPLSSSGQISEEYRSMAEQLNHYQRLYAPLSPFGESYIAIADLNLTEKEVQELVEGADYDQMLSANKDSISSIELIFYFQGLIIHSLDALLQHPDFGKKGAMDLIAEGELSIVRSDDGKLYNFSLDEKTGGTYRSRYSWMYYTDFKEPDSSDLEKFQSFFASDGFNEIYALDTDEGTKYLLTGFVRGCSYCFESFVQLVAFKDNQFYEEFSYSTNNRDWNEGVFYNPQTKTVEADFHFDDLTSSCDCAQNYSEEDAYFFQHTEDPFYFNVLRYRCKCSFVFNGKTFERSKASLERKYMGRGSYPEVLSFRLSKNQKEVKLLMAPDAALGYLFVRPDSLVEFSYPIDNPMDEDFVLSPNKDTLSFNNGDTQYQIYEVEQNGKLTEIGMLVTVQGKKYTLQGDITTAKGSLKKLDVEHAYNVFQKLD